jgi:uncharacterized protein
MRWQGRRGSVNVEDRRGMRIGRGAPIGCGGLIVVLLVSWLLGADPTQLLMLFQGGEGVGTSSTDVQAPTGEPDDQLGKFASVVLADTEETWRAVFSSRGKRYQEPRLVVFTEAVESACGISSAAVGPFYCPLDGKVYLDLSFFSELERFGAPGDFAAAYVIAHEVGHHVQNLLGIAEHVHGLQDRSSRGAANELSVRFELQADCLAGVWANLNDQVKNRLQPGDVEEGLNAASQIGDDMIQRRTQGTVVPDAFTHGSSEQRVRWFKTGLQSGEISQCDTFNSSHL